MPFHVLGGGTLEPPPLTFPRKVKGCPLTEGMNLLNADASSRPFWTKHRLPLHLNSFKTHPPPKGSGEGVERGVHLRRRRGGGYGGLALAPTRRRPPPAPIPPHQWFDAGGSARLKGTWDRPRANVRGPPTSYETLQGTSNARGTDECGEAWIHSLRQLGWNHQACHHGRLRPGSSREGEPKYNVLPVIAIKRRWKPAMVTHMVTG